MGLSAMALPRKNVLPAAASFLALVFLMAAIGRAADHGVPADGEKSEEAPAPVWQPGKPLNGRFDLSVLRAIHRIAAYRHVLPQVQTILSRPGATPVFLRIQICVEFGSEAGMAELQRQQSTVVSEIDAMVSRWEPRGLLRPAGKLALKDAIAEHLNQKLRTAVVRKIYITDFAMSPAR